MVSKKVDGSLQKYDSSLQGLIDLLHAGQLRSRSWQEADKHYGGQEQGQGYS